MKAPLFLIMFFFIIPAIAEQNGGGGNIGEQYIGVNETLTEGAYLTFQYQLSGYLMQLSYDPEYLQVVNVESGGLFSPYPTQWQISQTNNTVTAFETLLFGSPVTILTTSNMVTFSFEAVKPGRTELYLSDWRINDYSKNRLEQPLLYSRVYIGQDGEYVYNPEPEPTEGPSFWDRLKRVEYIDDITQLPTSSGNPAVVWQTSGHISAYIDVLGWKNLSRDGETYYIYGAPEDLAILDYQFYGTPPGSLENIDGSVTYGQEGKNLSVFLNVVMYWKEPVYCYDEIGMFICGWKHNQERATFTDIEQIPEQFVYPGNHLTIKQYNGSVYRPQVINLSQLSPGITAINLTTENGSLKQYFKRGQVAYTDKNIPYLNLTPTDKYEQAGQGISKLNHEIVFTSNLSSIVFFTPYGTSTSANITRVIMQETHIKSGVWGLIYIVFIFFGGLYVMYRTI